MDTSFQRVSKTTDEWYTPKKIIDNLCKFELDPCAPVKRKWETAASYYTKEDNGLIQNWEGKRIWLNPPYSRPLINQFIDKMIENNNGIMITFNRTDTIMFQDLIFNYASGIMFLKGRVKFYDENWNEGGPSGCGSVLVSFGEECSEILKNCKIKGKYFKIEPKNNKIIQTTLF